MTNPGTTTTRHPLPRGGPQSALRRWLSGAGRGQYESPRDGRDRPQRPSAAAEVVVW